MSRSVLALLIRARAVLRTAMHDAPSDLVRLERFAVMQRLVDDITRAIDDHERGR